MPKSISPLRYPGGKSVLLPIFQRLFVKNKINTIIETHCGGAGLSLALIANKTIKQAIIGDIDPLVSSFWDEILKNDIDKFIDRIRKVNVDMNTYNEQKDIYLNFKKGKKYSQFDLAFCFLFRNRTNRAGLLMAGPIGGYLQDANPKYKVHVRFNKERIINRITRINLYSKKGLIIFKKIDSIKMLSKYKSFKNCLFYIDPPYYQKGKDLYDSYYKHADHIALYNKLLKLKDKTNFILSYDNSKEIEKIYKNFKYVKIGKISHLANAKKQYELLFYSDNIVIPSITSKLPEIIKQ